MIDAKNIVCLWYDGGIGEAARFYCDTFPDTHIIAENSVLADNPGGKAGDELTVEMTIMGVPTVLLNGGSYFHQSEAFSFQVMAENQEETDRLWNAIVGNGGAESQCGWCKDKWGISWQITPRALMQAVLSSDHAAARRATEAMYTMGKIDIAAIEAAFRGDPS